MTDASQPKLDHLKTDFDTDNDEELIDFRLVEAAKAILFATSNDPLLELTPIVYTTKLDDMQTVKQDLSDLDAGEILKKLHSESLPMITYKGEVIKKREMDSRRPSFMRVSRVVSEINSNASKRQKVTEISKFSDNSQQQVRCKPCTVILKDIRHMVKNQQTIKLPTSSIAPPKVLEKSEVEITLEEITPESNNNSSKDDSNQPGIKKEIEIILSEKDPLKVEHIEFSVTKEHGTNKNIKKTNKVEEVQGSGRQRNRPKKRPRYVLEDSDDDDVPLQVMKKNKTPSRPSTPTPIVVGTKIDRGTQQAAFVTDMVYAPQEKYYLIVLTNKNDESTIYRTNATKLVTDYYRTNNKKTDMTNNELFLASLFPREEKIIERYCCWYRREDIISKICARKNFPIIIQMFLKQPHGCIVKDCECCCRLELTKDNNKTSKQNWREVIENHLEKSNGWIKDFLGINATNADRLVSKTLNNVPKTQKLKVKKTRETHFNNFLLCIENKNEDNLSEFELYSVGNNGDVQRTFFSNDREEVLLYQKSYQPMSESKGEIKEATICCWYKREKLMQDLKMRKASPAVLRRIQKPHHCAPKNCSCCCKPSVTLTGVNILPPTLHHTAMYEKSNKMVEIHFNNTKMQHTRNKNDVRPQLHIKAKKTTDACTAAVILSDCALKEDNLSLNTDIIDKFKTLKLGVSQLGTLEVILDAPAKTLSVQDLKVLSHTITLSINKMSDLGLTAEQFCTRINSQSAEPIQIKDFEATVLRSVETASTEDTAVYSYDNDNNDQIDYDDTDVVDTNVNVAAKSTASPSTRTDKGPSTSSTPKVTHVSIPILQKPTNPKAGLLSALSGLLQTKSKCYVDSFKSFFKPTAGFHEKPKVPKNLTSEVTQEESEAVNNEPISLPVISETFTLKPSKSGAHNVAPEAREGPLVHSGKSNFSLNNTNDLANSVESTVKLRVKPVSELVGASETPATIDIGNVQGKCSDWAMPVMSKVEPLSAAQTTASNVTPATVASDMKIPAFLIPKNVPIGTTFKLVSKPLSYSPNDNATTTSSTTNVLTLMPIRGPNIDTKNIRIIRPNLKEPPRNEIMPQLVPFRPLLVTQSPTPRVYKKMTSLKK